MRGFTWKIYILLLLFDFWGTVMSLEEGEFNIKHFLERRFSDENDTQNFCENATKKETWKFFVTISFGRFVPFSSGALIKPNLVATYGIVFLPVQLNKLIKCYGNVYVRLGPENLHKERHKDLLINSSPDCKWPDIAQVPEVFVPCIPKGSERVEVIEVITHPKFEVAFTTDHPVMGLINHLSHGLVLLRIPKKFSEADTIVPSTCPPRQVPTTCKFIYWEISKYHICEYDTNKIDIDSKLTQKIQEFFVKNKIDKQSVDEYLQTKMFSGRMKKFLGSGYPVVCDGKLQGVHDLELETLHLYVHENINKYNISWINRAQYRKSRITDGDKDVIKQLGATSRLSSNSIMFITALHLHLILRE